jgi:tRNA threonylcarbamoyladenosine biosynthesis protein TsaB
LFWSIVDNTEDPVLILALDTSTPTGSISLLDRDRIIAGRVFDPGIRHCQRLFVEIDELYKLGGFEVANTDVVAATIGPGSFTGLRIGLAAAKGICFAAEKPLVTVSTLEVLASRLPFSRHPICAMIDARRDQVYTATYDVSEDYPVELSAPRAVESHILANELAGGPVICTGNGAHAFAEMIAENPLAQRAPPHCSAMDASAAGWLALRKLDAGEFADLDSVEPLYLRAPDAKAPAAEPRDRN